MTVVNRRDAMIHYNSIESILDEIRPLESPRLYSVGIHGMGLGTGFHEQAQPSAALSVSLRDHVAQKLARWQASEHYSLVRDTIVSSRLPKNINKIFGYGLGTLQWRTLFQNDRPIVQHGLLMLLRERRGTRDI
jgi:hypothetical protein